MKKLIFDGTITAVSPIAQFGERVGRGPLARTEVLKHLIQANVAGADSVTRSGSVLVPIISGNTLRAKLRNSLAVALLEALDANKQKTLGFYDLLLLTSGGTFSVSGKAKTKSVDKAGLLATEELLKKNIVLSLFGGALGKIGVPGRLKVDIAFPRCVETSTSNIVSTHIDGPKASELIGKTFFTSQNKFVNGLSVLTRMDEAGVADYMNYDATANATKEAKEDAEKEWKENKRRKQEAEAAGGTYVPTPKEKPADEEAADSAGKIQQFQRHEYVIAGTVFESRFVIDNATELDLGAILYALRQFAMNPIIGGASSRGFGLVDTRYEISEVSLVGSEISSDKIAEVKTNCKPADGKSFFSFNEHEQSAADALKFFEEVYLKGITAGHLSIPDSFYR